MDLKRLSVLAGLLATALLATPASAGTQASALSIAAEVPNGCTVSASPMNFGMVTGTFTAVRTTAQVQLDCVPRLDYVITLDRGLNAQGRQRRMANAAGTRFLRYNIYNDAGYSREWDDRGGGRVFARSQSGSAYALVSTGRVAGVTVTREHAPAGVTDSSGLLLVENVTPLVPVQFDIDPDKLPLEAVARSTYRRVVAARGGVTRVRLDVSAFRSLPVRLIGPSGDPLPIGLVLTGRTTGTRYMVGYDGLIDLTALAEDQALAPADGSWAGCVVELPKDVDRIEGQLDLHTSCAAQLLARK